MIDSILADGGKVVPRKRPFNANRVADLTELGRNGHLCKTYFERQADLRLVPTIPPENYGSLINNTAGFALDINSEAYKVMYVASMSGEKERVSLYARTANMLQKEPEVAHHWDMLGGCKAVRLRPDSQPALIVYRLPR